MANAGGNTEFAGEVNFDDEASGRDPRRRHPLVATLEVQARGLRPDRADAPAPPLNGEQALSVFDGTSAVGEWSLYVFDDNAPSTPATSPGRPGSRPGP